ncbi:MAG: hypothetical protein IKS51_04245 [Erysipelotrichaceae bacterium]|nr:hypothetical protein [Erysipelotrichaceae bacterium]
MGRIVKSRKKKRRINFLHVAEALFTVSLILWLATSLLVNTMNTSLAMKIQAMQEEVDALKLENQSLRYDINTLQNKERIYALAQEADLYQDSDNIIAVTGG